MRRCFTLVPMGLLVVLGACGKEPGDPMSYLDRNSSLAAVVAASPELTAQVRKAMGDGAGPMRSDEDRRKYAEHVAAPIVNEFLKVRMAGMDDEMMSRMAGVTVDRVKETIASGDDCMRPIEGRDSSYVSAFGDARMKPIFLEIMRRPPLADPRKADPAEVVMYKMNYSRDMAQRGGLEVERLDELMRGAEPSSREEKCRMLAGIMATFVALPPAEGAPLIRAMYR